jgi:hypothetical protein
LQKKTISKPGGGAGPTKSKKDNCIAGRFIAKALHLPARSRFGEGRAAPLGVGYMRF